MVTIEYVNGRSKLRLKAENKYYKRVVDPPKEATEQERKDFVPHIIIGIQKERTAEVKTIPLTQVMDVYTDKMEKLIKPEKIIRNPVTGF